MITKLIQNLTNFNLNFENQFNFKNCFSILSQLQEISSSDNPPLIIPHQPNQLSTPIQFSKYARKKYKTRFHLFSHKSPSVFWHFWVRNLFLKLSHLITLKYFKITLYLFRMKQTSKITELWKILQEFKFEKKYKKKISSFRRKDQENNEKFPRLQSDKKATKVMKNFHRVQWEEN